MTYIFAKSAVVTIGTECAVIWEPHTGFRNATQGGAVAFMSPLSAWEIVQNPDHSVPTKDEARYHPRYYSAFA